MSGIEKYIDKLGRVVIPIEYRKKLGAVTNSRVFVSMIGDSVIVSAYDKHCVICGSDINKKNKFTLCDCCIAEIKSEN